MNPGKLDLRGTASTFGSYFIWGLLPIYWKQVEGISSLEILSHRIVGAFLLILGLAAIIRLRGILGALKNPKTCLLVTACGVLVGINWGLYIFSVNTGRIVEASLGYYINPLVSVLMGVIILKERLNLLQKGALLLAFGGVLWMTLSYGKFPWLSLTLAFSFALYGLFKKLLGMEALPALAVETAVLVPFALIYLITLMVRGELGFLHGDRISDLYIVGAGVVTLTPLFLFGWGARRIPLSTVGFLQYIAPTLMLIIGTLGYGEPFDLSRLGSFLFIWAGLILYTVSLSAGRRSPDRGGR